MKYGYDSLSKCLFSWDRDFKFEGKIDSPPDGSFLVPEGEDARVMAELMGCMFLSGCRDVCVVVRAKGMDEEVYGLAGIMPGRIRTFRGVTLRGIASVAMKGKPVCLCGEIVRSPEKVSEFCRMFPSLKVYVCPVVEELAAFGALVPAVLDKERPRRANLCIPDSRQADYKFVAFDPKLEGDGYGRMAYHVSKGRPVLNQMMSGPGASQFYGRVLTDGIGGCGLYFIRSQEMDEFFLEEPLSVKLYGAMCVPVRVANTEKFQKATEYNGKEVDVMCVSDMIPGLVTFTGFYRAMSGRGFFGSSPLCQIKQLVGRGLVFRSDKGYRVDLGKDGRLDAEGIL